MAVNPTHTPSISGTPNDPSEVPSYAKAAAIMHHTSGVASWDEALHIYEMFIDQDRTWDDAVALYDGVVMHHAYESMDESDFAENVQNLAYAIEQSRIVFELKGK